ncbi:UDP-N-acetylglucosamine-N-acetylmuramylpentapeptide N-acetylglucosamine transferase [Sulfuritortus calidifontis]|uniref:UDP-N-acetylglucosamine--N-acetylmuramyl-(pentapeptide) pyrophosphoryl-undecaprenol N-acetylglucosamine transferase n=1 Tax=Sulfuritortus calidifontis TaxID=1914471 RepID=A0A4R3JWH2_9PROT|nr:undecaprenyldiphospho-muramoylpentapeptide beta-N-acetylglucosaminyltransferase [Sulfuritortus calidifontis]TCS71034.1 UDP-N-acetylglucosamine-N-acetylmuramylpentapeptide N-acetylglucosamine transferase [Sulfuritortus calidifontis]
MSARTVLIMAGGTGGHIMPALAVAERLRGEGWRVVWLGTRAGMEARLVPERGFAIEWLNFGGVRGKGPLRLVLLPLQMLIAFWQALRALFRVRPDVVAGFGGYPAFPGGMMAVLLARPLVIHEQNAIAGMTNRVLAKLADRVLLGLPLKTPLAGNALWVGNPVRPEIAVLPAPEARYAEHQGPLRLLVVGGSLGAAALNDTVPKALALLPAAQRPVVRHQAGAKHIEQLQANYAAAGVAAECLAFIDDMAAAYGWADLVICRAGALTVAEVAAAGVAAAFVPFPHAVDDHQSANARFLSEREAAWLLPQKELTPAGLAQWLGGLDRAALQARAIKARALAKPDATERVADVCKELAA